MKKSNLQIAYEESELADRDYGAGLITTRQFQSRISKAFKRAFKLDEVNKLKPSVPN